MSEEKLTAKDLHESINYLLKLNNYSNALIVTKLRNMGVVSADQAMEISNDLQELEGMLLSGKSLLDIELRFHT